MKDVRDVVTMRMSLEVSRLGCHGASRDLLSWIAETGDGDRTLAVV